MAQLRRLGWPVVAALLLATTLAEAQYVTILHLNDLHGQLLPFESKKQSVGGIARIASMVKETEAWNGPHGVATLLVEAGDILQGTPLSTVFHGEPDVTCLNLMGVDAMAIGNHEFDFGQENLAARRRQARFPIISANIRRAGTLGPLAKPFTTCDLGGTPALLFGLTSRDTAVESLAANVAGLVFLDPVEVAREIVEANRAQYPIIIALTHIGLPNDLALAKAVPGIDLIIGGHSHDAVPAPIRVGDTLVCQAGARGRFLGQVDALFENGEITRHRGFLRPVDDTTAPDAAVAKVVDGHAQRLGAKIKRVIAQAPFDLDGHEPLVRSQETNLGDLLADLARAYAQADVAFVNGGGIRAGISRGPITIEDVMMVDPFGNQVSSVELTGEQLLEALQLDAGLPRPDGGFLQVSGLTMTLRGGEAADVKVAGAPLDPERTYKVALSDFLLTGGNGYTVFAKGSKAKSLGTTFTDIIIAGLEAMGSVKAPEGGRITIEP